MCAAHLNHGVLPSGRNPLAVGAEFEAVDCFVMALVGEDAALATDVPQLQKGEGG